MADESEVFKRKRDTLTGRKLRRNLCARHVAEAVGTIERGCEIYGLNKGKWSLVDLIEHCLASTGPADVCLSTWTAANADIGFAMRLLANGTIRRLRFVVDFSFPARQPAYCAALREAFGDDAIRMTKNHVKFCLLRNDAWNLVIRTSMNLNENRRLESWELSDDAELAGWLAGIVDRLFADTTAAETFARSAGEHARRFEAEWEDEGAVRPEEVEAAATGADVRKYFDDAPLGNDLRRAGLTFGR